MTSTFRSPNSPGRQVPPAPRYPRPPSDDEEEDDSDEDELVRPGSSGSDASSNVTTVSATPITPIHTQTSSGGYFPPQPRSATSPHHPMPNPARRPSGRGPSVELSRHRSRHHSQGFFEPSLPTASSDQASNVSASRIAAQAAMQQTKRQQNAMTPIEDDSRPRRSGSSSPPLIPPPMRLNQPSPQPPPPSGNVATTAANVVFPRANAPPVEQQPEKQKKKKLFSKPKHIGISSHKDLGKDRGLPSPSKISGLSRMVSGSTTAMTDLSSTNSTIYNLANASVSTVVPADRPLLPEKEKDKDKHKHHFLSRQKLKLKDRVEDHFNLTLSSASSNSRPADPNAPQSLYSFTPASPAPGATFGKSVSGLDLLHGGRALREKKKEEKALAESEQMEWLANNAGGPTTPGVFPGPSSVGSSGTFPDPILRETLQGFGLNNMTTEDAWDFLKAKLLVIFDGEDVRIAIEDLNKLVLVHLQRCVVKRAPASIIMDLQDLLQTGFANLNHSSLIGLPDERLVPHLVQVWLLVFGTILPFIQAVFLPLDLEFKGCGSLMTAREADEFWSTLHVGGTLDVRSIVLMAFRDCMILNRYDALKANFSRLSLESINSGFLTLSVTTKSTSNGGRPGTAASLDAGFGSYNSQSSTLLSTVADSYSSDGNTALANHPRPSSSDSRSRATSNTSSNADPLFFQSIASPPTSSKRPAPTIIHRGSSADSSHIITETVGRMLQCISVLASVQTDDSAQERIEILSKALKHNWLGRGRTGRDRRGFVGAKIRPVMVGGPPVFDDADSLTTAGISIGASTSTGGSRGRGDSSSSEWSSTVPEPGMSVRSGARRELSVR
ncbi:HbrB-like [Penicillium digitatum]|nr:HbrB-like [Penicillium digitatum]